MSIQTEITRIENARNTIRNKAVELGIAEGTAKMDVLAAAIDGIVDQGAVSATVMEGDTYTIPKGYHNGSGTVSGTAGGGNYKLQSKQVTPTKQQQNVTPDSGYYGMSDVTVAAIPVQYQDVSSVTAVAEDVLANKNIVTRDGQLTAGTMPNIGAVSATLNTTAKSYTVPKGYHSGAGTVSIVTEEKTAVPTKAPQDITPTTGKVLSKVTVEAIPDEFISTADATAAAGEILSGKTAYVGGAKVEGTMANNGAVVKKLDAATTSVTIPTGYHDGTGAVSIEVETKSAMPTESQQTVSPTAGKVLTSVTIEAIPAKYKDTTPVTATAADVLDGKFIVTGTGTIEGTMPNNGAVAKTIDGLTTSSVTIPEGYTTGGTVSLDSSIEDALASI